MRSAEDVVTTIMCEEGNMVEYSVAYLAMWRPWAPVHVMSRIRDGAEMLSVGVVGGDGVEGMRSHIAELIGSKPGIALYDILVMIVVIASIT